MLLATATGGRLRQDHLWKLVRRLTRAVRIDAPDHVRPGPSSAVARCHASRLLHIHQYGVAVRGLRSGRARMTARPARTSSLTRPPPSPGPRWRPVRLTAEPIARCLARADLN